MTAPHASARAVIALGANLGDREATLRAAVSAIDGLPQASVIAASGVVESHAMKLAGVDTTAPNYMNAVILAEVTVGALELLHQLHAIEKRFGRVRETVWGDRTLDLDLIAFDTLTMVSEQLTLPHPRAWQRAFVLAPWLQIQPDAVIPGRGTIASLRAAATDQVWEHPSAPLIDTGPTRADPAIGEAKK